MTLLLNSFEKKKGFTIYIEQGPKYNFMLLSVGKKKKRTSIYLNFGF